VTAAFFSFMAGIFHAYYTVALAPMVAGMAAIGAGMLWSRRERLWARATMAGLVLGTAVLAWAILLLVEGWMPWLRYTVLGLGVLAAVLLLLPRSGRGVRVAAASTALVAVLLAPFAYTLQTISTAHRGSIVTAGPDLGGGGLFGARPSLGLGPHTNGSPLALPPTGPGNGAPVGGSLGTGGGKGPLTSPLAAGGLLQSATVSADVISTLEEDANSYTWVAAAIGSNEAAGYQLATGDPVMPVGGFNGSDPSPTLAQFKELVAQGRIHWFIAGGVGKPNGGSSDSSEIATWVEKTFAVVTVDRVRLYDLTS
jgi:4-amino-4-deoxy-L-arabinose transferase-like glycosyltransferase